MLKNVLLYFIVFSFVFYACQDDVTKELDGIIDDTDALSVDTVQVDTVKEDSIVPFSDTYAGYWYNTHTTCSIDMFSELGRQDFYIRYGTHRYFEETIRKDTTTNNRDRTFPYTTFLNIQYAVDMNITLNDSVLVGFLTMQHYVMFEWEINGKMDYVYPENDQGIIVNRRSEYFKLDTLEEEDNAPVFTVYSYAILNNGRPMVSEGPNFYIEELTDSTMHLSISGVRWCLNDTTGIAEPCYQFNHDMYYLKRRGE